MGRVVVIEHLTLDGVLQAPGHPDEDRRKIAVARARRCMTPHRGTSTTARPPAPKGSA